MRLFTLNVSVAALLLLGSAAHAVPITYEINRTVGTGSVIGTITTDGTLDNLNESNITGWNFVLDSGQETFLFDGGQSFSLVTDPGFLTATTTALTINWDLFGILQWSDAAGWGYEVSNTFTQIEQIDPPGAGGIFSGANLSGLDVFATRTIGVSEPGVLAILGLGLGGLSLVRRRR